MKSDTSVRALILTVHRRERRHCTDQGSTRLTALPCTQQAGDTAVPEVIVERRLKVSGGKSFYMEEEAWPSLFLSHKTVCHAHQRPHLTHAYIRMHASRPPTNPHTTQKFLHDDLPCLYPPQSSSTIRAIAHPSRSHSSSNTSPPQQQPRLRDLRPPSVVVDDTGTAAAAAAALAAADSLKPRVLLAVGPESGWEVSAICVYSGVLGSVPPPLLP